MTKRENIITKSPYEYTKPNEAMSLYDGDLSLRSEKYSFSGSGNVTLRWVPSPTVIVEIRDTTETSNLTSASLMRHTFGPGEDSTLLIPGSLKGSPFFVTSTKSGSSTPPVIRGCINGSLEIGDGKALLKAILHPVNMRGYYNLEASDPANRLSPIIVMDDGQWHLELTPLITVDEIEDALKETGGFSITHVLTVERVDGSQFGSIDLNDLNLALFYYLTFVEGRVVHAILPLGYSEKDVPVWTSWSPWHIDGWKSVLSWVDPHHGGAISQAFSGFMSKWREAGWRDLFQLVIQWYAHSNRNDSGLENGIVMSAMALDAISWQLLVVQDSVISGQGFKSLTATDRLRIMCSFLKIPLDLYPSFQQLKGKAVEFNWTDSADAVVTVRNNIVHPDAKLRSRLFTNQIFYETWSTSLWILEMVLLRVFGFDGNYSDRRSMPAFIGTVAPVPWRQP